MLISVMVLFFKYLKFDSNEICALLAIIKKQCKNTYNPNEFIGFKVRQDVFMMKNNL